MNKNSILKIFIFILLFAASAVLPCRAQEGASKTDGISGSLSLGFDPVHYDIPSSPSIVRIKKDVPVCVGGNFRSICSRSDAFSDDDSEKRFIVSHNWIKAVDLKSGEIYAQKAVRGAENISVYAAGEEQLILRDGDEISCCSQKDLKVLWKKSFKGSENAPAVFFSSRMAVISKHVNKSESEQKKYLSFSRIECTDLESGKEVWNADTDGSVQDAFVIGDSLFLVSEASVSDKYVQDNSSSGYVSILSVLDLKSGALKKSLTLYKDVIVRRWSNRIAVCQTADASEEQGAFFEVYDVNLNNIGSKNLPMLPAFIEICPDSDYLWMGMKSRSEDSISWQFLSFAPDSEELSEQSYSVYDTIEQIVLYRDGAWMFLKGSESKYPIVYWCQGQKFNDFSEMTGDLQTALSESKAFVLDDTLYYISKAKPSDVPELCVYFPLKSSLLSWKNGSASFGKMLVSQCGGVFFTEEKTDPVTGGPLSKVHCMNMKGLGIRFSSEWLEGKAEGIYPDFTENGSFGNWNILTGSKKIYKADGNKGNTILTVSAGDIFNWTKLNNLFGVLIITGCIVFYIFKARGGEKLFIRSIAGLGALDEAVGRATEMGRPVLYIPGLSDIDETQTMAGLSILGHVSKCTAEYDIPIMVPNCSSVVMVMAQDIVRQAYVQAGNPDTYVSDYICYLSSEQFGFAAGACGLMVREKPAAVLYMGNFFAEGLMLAETGNAAGAVQIAGTAAASQLPFFVAACDYTLMGEELYAASAYLSGDAMQIGSIKGQDGAKAIIMTLIIVGVVLVSFGCRWLDFVWASL